MNCRECGQRLAWEEGAFCRSCMRLAEERLRVRKRSEAEAAGTIDGPTILGQFCLAKHKAERKDGGA